MSTVLDPEVPKPVADALTDLQNAEDALTVAADTDTKARANAADSAKALADAKVAYTTKKKAFLDAIAAAYPDPA